MTFSFMIMDYLSIINKFYPTDNELRHILLVHSRSVADKSLAIAAHHPELKLDCAFLEEAAMLHDIGIFKCHGRIGAELLRSEGFPRHARVCERHTGAGITKAQIIAQNLPLPQQDFLPETMEEKVICYADKFFSKTHLDREKTIEQAEKSLSKFGDEGVLRFREWEKCFD